MAEKTMEAAQPKSQAPGREMTRATEQYLTPPVDIYETNDGLTVVADLPGVTKDGLNIQVRDDILTIEARAQHATPGNLLYQEFPVTGFFREFQLPDTVDTAGITAELKHGVLTLHLPKAERAKPRQIQVQVTP